VPRFEYRAADAAGEEQRGRCECADERELERELERRGLLLLEAQPGDARGGPGSAPDAHELAGLVAQLATLLAARVPIVEGLEGLAERQERAAARAWVLALADDLRQGASLSAALDARAAELPTAVCAAVRAGEQSGALPQVLEELARHLDAQAALRARALQALVYPLVLGTALGVLVLILLGFLLPRITALYPRGAAALPGETRFLLALSDGLRTGWPLGAVALAVGVALWVHGRRRAAWRAAAARALCRVPRLGRLLRSVAAARFASTAAVLQRAGCDALTLLRVGGEASGNAAFRAAVERAGARVERGALFSEALALEPLVDRTLVQVVAVGERSGSLAPALARAAQRYEAEIPREIARALALFEPVLLAAGGVLVAWILLAALLPIFELYEQFP